MFKLPFRIARWAIYIRSICPLVLLKIFWNFRSTSKKRFTVRSYRFQLFYKVGILKKSGKNKKTAVLELLFKEVSKNKETPSPVFYWEFCETLKNTYFAEHLRWSWSLSLKKSYIVDFHGKVFEWLVANEFLSNSYLKKDLFNQIIKKWPPKGVFVDLLEKYLVMNVGL